MIRHHAIGARRGSAILYQVVILVALLAITSLAVDYAAAQLAKWQLRCAADSAALAGATALTQSSTIVSQRATAVAACNSATGCSVQLLSNDIVVGQWDTAARAFTVGASPSNAVMITTRREAATGNAVALPFTSSLGFSSIDVHATAIAYQPSPPPDYNFAGIDSVNFSSLGVLAQINGRVVSNGNISIGAPLGPLVKVNGDARSWQGSVSKGTLAQITGSTSRLTSKLVFPSVELPEHNDNSQIAGYLNASNDFVATVSATIPPGNYVVRDLNLVAGLNVNLQGGVRFFVTRNVNIAVAANRLGNSVYDPSDFKIRVAPGGSVNFLATLPTPIYMDLYAPDSPISITVGVNHFHGRLIGKTLDIMLPVVGEFSETTTTPDPLPLARLVK